MPIVPYTSRALGGLLRRQEPCPRSVQEHGRQKGCCHTFYHDMLSSQMFYEYADARGFGLAPPSSPEALLSAGYASLISAGGVKGRLTAAAGAVKIGASHIQ